MMNDLEAFKKVEDGDYFLGVISNAYRHGRSQAKVEFGTTGGGSYPNYQITEPGGQPNKFLGRTHASFDGSNGGEGFNPDNLSKPMSVAAVLALASFVIALPASD